MTKIELFTVKELLEKDFCVSVKKDDNYFIKNIETDEEIGKKCLLKLGNIYELNYIQTNSKTITIFDENSNEEIECFKWTIKQTIKDGIKEKFVDNFEDFFSDKIEKNSLDNNLDNQNINDNNLLNSIDNEDVLPISINENNTLDNIETIHSIEEEKLNNEDFNNEDFNIEEEKLNNEDFNIEEEKLNNEDFDIEEEINNEDFDIEEEINNEDFDNEINILDNSKIKEIQKQKRINYILFEISKNMSVKYYLSNTENKNLEKKWECLFFKQNIQKIVDKDFIIAMLVEFEVKDYKEIIKIIKKDSSTEIILKNGDSEKIEIINS